MPLTAPQPSHIMATSPTKSLSASEDSTNNISGSEGHAPQTTPSLHLLAARVGASDQPSATETDMPYPLIAITPPSATDGTTAPTARALAAKSALPTTICSYYVNSINGIGQGCLRVNCKFFHGTEEQLADLRKRHKRLKSPSNSSNASTRSASSNGEVAKEGAPTKKVRAKKEEPPQRLKMVKDAELGSKRPIVCLNYLTDTCHRPGCRFLHLPCNVRPLPMTVCDYFATGTCTRKRCRFFHGTQEVLSRMHAQGVTMYNPITNEAHDPSTSLEELIKLQERTTVPLPAAEVPPPNPNGLAPAYDYQRPALYQVCQVVSQPEAAEPCCYGGYPSAHLRPNTQPGGLVMRAQQQQQGPIRMVTNSGDAQQMHAPFYHHPPTHALPHAMHGLHGPYRGVGMQSSGDAFGPPAGSAAMPMPSFGHPYGVGGNMPPPQPSGGHTTIIIQQSGPAECGTAMPSGAVRYLDPTYLAAPQGLIAPPPTTQTTTIHGLPDGLLNAILQQHPNATIITSTAPMAGQTPAYSHASPTPMLGQYGASRHEAQWTPY